ncbi:EfeM/EfeO family lipoprotein [Vibrio taketomensis]|uniref:EfeM/EfeO family lipoprotein n=1 Tax=Vibrio taketomensis TaxID=2572923 RepID=UPI00138A458E|nr:EfeM/EfeO family lipoprotein [Vibrio taketomensis]
MNSKTKPFLTASCLLLSLIISASVSAKALRSPVQTGDDIIVAKGDIPTPAKYHQATQAVLTYASQNVTSIILQLNKLNTALSSGDVSQAQQFYVQAHQYYERIRPIIRLFGHTDRIINSRASDFLQGTSDYRFKGFHLVEYLLFDSKNLPAAKDAVDELLMYTKDLKQRIAQEQIEIPKLVQSSADFIEMAIEVKLAGKENLYSRSDIADMAANVAGSQHIIEQISAFIPPSVLKPIDHHYQQINAILAHYLTPNGHYKTFEALTAHDKKKLYSLLSQQADLLATLRATLDVDVYFKF